MVKEFPETDANGKLAVCGSSEHVSSLERAVDELGFLSDVIHH